MEWLEAQTGLIQELQAARDGEATAKQLLTQLQGEVVELAQGASESAGERMRLAETVQVQEAELAALRAGMASQDSAIISIQEEHEDVIAALKQEMIAVVGSLEIGGTLSPEDICVTIARLGAQVEELQREKAASEAQLHELSNQNALLQSQMELAGLKQTEAREGGQAALNLERAMAGIQQYRLRIRDMEDSKSRMETDLATATDLNQAHEIALESLERRLESEKAAARNQFRAFNRGETDGDKVAAWLHIWRRKVTDDEDALAALTLTFESDKHAAGLSATVALQLFAMKQMSLTTGRFVQAQTSAMIQAWRGNAFRYSLASEREGLERERASLFGDLEKESKATQQLLQTKATQKVYTAGAALLGRAMGRFMDNPEVGALSAWREKMRLELNGKLRELHQHRIEMQSSMRVLEARLAHTDQAKQTELLAYRTEASTFQRAHQQIQNKSEAMEKHLGEQQQRYQRASLAVIERVLLTWRHEGLLTCLRSWHHHLQGDTIDDLHDMEEALHGAVRARDIALEGRRELHQELESHNQLLMESLHTELHTGKKMTALMLMKKAVQHIKHRRIADAIVSWRQVMKDDFYSNLVTHTSRIGAAMGRDMDSHKAINEQLASSLIDTNNAIGPLHEQIETLEEENEILRAQLNALHDDLSQETTKAKKAYRESEEELLTARIRLKEHDSSFSEHVDRHLSKKEAALRHMRLALGRIQHGNMVTAIFAWRHSMLVDACSNAFQHVEHLKTVVETHEDIVLKERQRMEEADQSAAAFQEALTPSPEGTTPHAFG